MYTFLERKCHENYNGDIYFLPKIIIFEKITKNMFLPFFFQNKLEENKNSKKLF